MPPSSFKDKIKTLLGFPYQKTRKPTKNVYEILPSGILQLDPKEEKTPPPPTPMKRAQSGSAPPDVPSPPPLPYELEETSDEDISTTVTGTEERSERSYMKPIDLEESSPEKAHYPDVPEAGYLIEESDVEAVEDVKGFIKIMGNRFNPVQLNEEIMNSYKRKYHPNYAVFPQPKISPFVSYKKEYEQMTGWNTPMFRDYLFGPFKTIGITTDSPPIENALYI